LVAYCGLTCAISSISSRWLLSQGWVSVSGTAVRTPPRQRSSRIHIENITRLTLEYFAGAHLSQLHLFAMELLDACSVVGRLGAHSTLTVRSTNTSLTAESPAVLWMPEPQLISGHRHGLPFRKPWVSRCSRLWIAVAAGWPGCTRRPARR
jgi:hypothetical protein